MKTMTSAYANKLLKSLEEDKTFWTNKEMSSCTYTAAINEEAVVPEYDYQEVADKIEEIDEKILKIKHAINLHNVTSRVLIGTKEMSIDAILIRMAQRNKRKLFLDGLRKRLPKTREMNYAYASRTASPEYTYINYDLDLIKSEYERVSDEIMELQMALDKHNQTEMFDVDI